ncbi:MAG: amidohydrolase family protein [Bacillota bacterium]
MIVDCHVHVLPPEMISKLERVCQKEPYLATLASSPRARFASCEEALAESEDKGIRMVVFGYALEDPGRCREINEYVAAMVKSRHDRLLGLMVVNPARPGLEAEFARGIDLGLKGVGELFPEGQGFDLLGREIRTLAGLCKEAGMPLMLHVNEQVGHVYPGKTNVGPVQAWEFARKHPGLNIVYPHLGGGLPFYELMPEVAKDLENVWYDTAAVPLLYKCNVYRVLKEAGVLRKTLFGSDFPLLGYERYKRQITEAGLSSEESEAILSRNALSLFPIV